MENEKLDLVTPKPRDQRALNAYRHGLTGHVLILAPDDQAAYTAHCKGILDDLAPSGALEMDLAQSIADDRWRLKRAKAIEANMFARDLIHPCDLTAHNEQVDNAMSKTRTWLDVNAELSRLTLYEGRILRQVERTLALLTRMQQERRDAFRQAAEESALLAQLTENTGETYQLPGHSPAPRFVFSADQVTAWATHYRRIAEAKKYLAAPRRLGLQACSRIASALPAPGGRTV
jgi:hypothetical protein